MKRPSKSQILEIVEKETSAKMILERKQKYRKTINRQ